MMQKATLNPTPDQTFEVEGAGAYDFAKVLARSREMERAGNVEGACNERYAAFQRLAELIPENEEVILEWNHRNSRAALELIYASAVDHFLIDDFELSAALLEMLLDLDPEDHLEGSTLLAFDYVAMDEQELFDEGIVEVCRKLADSGIRVIVAGLDMDYTGKPFGPMPALMATAEYVTKVHAICVRCGNLAHHSHRLTADDKQVMLGAQDSYEPVCRHCFRALTEKE